MSLGDLFISYSRTDRDTVASIAKRLDRVYGQIWFDRELFGGQDWWQEILSQIANCDVFVYMISPDSIRSEYCVAEYNEARRLNKPIVPIMVRSYLDLPKDLRQLQIIDISLGVTEDNLTELYAAINYHLPQVVAAKTGAMPPKRATTTMHKVSNTTPKPQPKRAGLPILPLLLTLLVVGGAVGGVLLLANQSSTTGAATETSQALAAANTQEVTTEPTADATEPTTAPAEASDESTATIAPTATVTATAAPEETAATAAETSVADARPLEDAPIHLIYTDEDFVLYNRTGQFQDVSGLTFARTTSAGRELRFVSGDWDNNFVDVAELRGGACVQLGQTPAISSNPPDFCSRSGWLAPNSGSWFWTGTDAEAVFTVSRDGVQLAECPVAVESDDASALTCGLYLTPPE